MATTFYPGQVDYIEKLNDLADDVAAVTSPPASTVVLTDTGGYFTSTHVEGALQEVGADLAAITVPTASDITITDAGGYFTSTNVEGALQEAYNAIPVDSSELAEGSTHLFFSQTRVRSTPLTGLSTSTNSAVVATDTVLEAAGKLQAQINAVSGTAPVASAVTIADTGNYYTGTQVEAALQEVGASLATKQATPGAFTSLGSITLSTTHDSGRFNPTSTGNTYTIPFDLTGASGALNFGCMFSNPGTVIISPASGVTVNGLSTSITCTATAKKHLVGVVQTAANTFVVLGV